jgi:hypothetical protein
VSATPDSDDQFTAIGDYTPRQADRLLSALENARIKFQIECDDGIHGSLSRFGTFGTEAKIRVFIASHQMDAAERVRIDLFGESSRQI